MNCLNGIAEVFRKALEGYGHLSHSTHTPSWALHRGLLLPPSPWGVFLQGSSLSWLTMLLHGLDAAGTLFCVPCTAHLGP